MNLHVESIRDKKEEQVLVGAGWPNTLGGTVERSETDT